MCIRLLILLSLVLTLTWADQAWSTLLDPITNRDDHPDTVGTLRRRPQKSVFTVPHLSRPACPTGQSADSSGRCVQIVQVDQSLQLQFLLQKLNNLHSTAGTSDDYEYDDEEDDGKPFQVALPLAASKKPEPSTTETIRPTIVVAPTNGKFGHVYTESGADRLESELEHLKDAEDSTVYNVKFDSNPVETTQQPETEATTEVVEETTTNLPETTTSKPVALHDQPFWWVPPGWEAERTKERPLLLRFWAKMPLVRDPGTLSLPETIPESVIRTRTSGQRGTGRYPSEQYYREVSAHDLYNVLGAKHWRRFRATDR